MRWQVGRRAGVAERDWVVLQCGSELHSVTRLPLSLPARSRTVGGSNAGHVPRDSTRGREAARATGSGTPGEKSKGRWPRQVRNSRRVPEPRSPGRCQVRPGGDSEPDET